MAGVYKQTTIPVLHLNETKSVSHKDKANKLVKAFQKVHSSEKVSEENRRRRITKVEREQDKLQDNCD